jgi:hypothetical protein
MVFRFPRQYFFIEVLGEEIAEELNSDASELMSAAAVPNNHARNACRE